MPGWILAFVWNGYGMGRKTLAESGSREKLSRHVLLDNVEAHTKDNFTKLVNSLNGVVWYRLSSATD